MIVGTGIDVIEIARIERVLASRGERFTRRVFATGEIATCEASGRAAIQYAVRFAAKEAVLKALGTGLARGVRWVDVETLPDAAGRSGRLGLKLHGRAAELARQEGGGTEDLTVQLAIARTRSHAMAVVLIESSPQ